VKEETLDVMEMMAALAIPATTDAPVAQVPQDLKDPLVDPDKTAHLAIPEVPVDLELKVTQVDQGSMALLVWLAPLARMVSQAAQAQLDHPVIPALPVSQPHPLAPLDSLVLTARMDSPVAQVAQALKVPKDPQASQAVPVPLVNLGNQVLNLVQEAITELLEPLVFQAKMVYLALPPALQVPLVNLALTVIPVVPVHPAKMASLAVQVVPAMMVAPVALELLVMQVNPADPAMMDVLVAQVLQAEMEAQDPLDLKANQAIPVPQEDPVAQDLKDLLVPLETQVAQDSQDNQADLVAQGSKDLKDLKARLEIQEALAQLANLVNLVALDLKVPLEPLARPSHKPLMLRLTLLLLPNPLGQHLHPAILSQHGPHRHHSNGSQLLQLHLKAHRSHRTAKSIDRFGEKPTILHIHSIVLLSLERLQSCMITLPLFFLTVANSRSFTKH